MSELTERQLGAQLKREAMDPNKRGNPPFEASSHAAGLERRVKRLSRWNSRAREAARWLLDGTEHQKQFAEQWWREQLDQPKVVASEATSLTPSTTRGE